MKKVYTYLREISLIIALLVLATAAGWGQEYDEPITVDNGRIALVGPHCLINQFAVSANVLTQYSNLENVTDNNLNNYATITGISVGVGASPIFSVKDTKNTYAKGTTAGFSLVSTEGLGLLTLDIIRMFSIALYKDGEQQGDPVVVTTGQDAGGIGLNLIKIPGTDAVSIDVSIEAEYDFDEIYLMTNGVSVSVIEQLSVKYAFVGDPIEYTLTHDGLPVGIEIDLDKCKSMPWLVEDWYDGPWDVDDCLEEAIFDNDTTNKVGTGGVAVGEWCHIHIAVNKEFEAGTEVGFKYESKGLLDLSLGGYTTISLYDINGKEVQTETVEAGLLGLGVATSGETVTTITSKVPFAAARLTIGAVVGLSLGEAVGVYYGFIREKPQVYHHCEIKPNIDATICNQETTYQLVSNPEVPVSWELIDFEPYVDANSLEDIDTTSIEIIQDPTNSNIYNVTGLKEDGIYTFKATATNCTSTPKCYEYVRLQKGVISNPIGTCGSPLMNKNGEEKYILSTSGYQVEGALISISETQNSQNLIDDDENNYMTYVSGLSVASNMGIVGIKTADNSIMGKDINGDKRVGFIVENASTFLDADVLQFMRIRLYRNGQEVKDSRLPEVIDESSTIGVGLLGSEKSQKVRYSIAVPSNLEFDEFQLWTSGVLNLYNWQNERCKFSKPNV